eukprot:2053518-Amphidinium_carterae.1
MAAMVRRIVLWDTVEWIEGASDAYTIAKCKNYFHGVGYPAPHPRDIPMELRQLPWSVIACLRPFENDTGHPPGKDIRASDGYCLHMDVIRFRREPQTVKTRIARLAGPEQKIAKRALRYLRANAESNSYSKFYDRHKDFLADYGLLERKLPRPTADCLSMSWNGWAWS